MASLANAIDFLLGDMVRSDKAVVKGRTKLASCSPNWSGMKSLLALCYLVMSAFLVIGSDYSKVPGLPMFSYVCFTGSTLGCVSYLTLYMRVKASKSVAGISSQSLCLHAVALAAKLSTTTMHDGYLPADKTGDFLIQMVDSCSLVLVLAVLYATHKMYPHTYQDEQDDLPVGTVLIFALGLATFLHADLNRCFWLDVVWSFGLNVEVFQMLPQLHMLTKGGGAVDAGMTHYVVNQFLSSGCRLAFWVWAIEGCAELSTPKGYGWNMAKGGIYILSALGVEILINLDFMYYFVKAWVQGRKTVTLPQELNM